MGQASRLQVWTRRVYFLGLCSPVPRPGPRQDKFIEVYMTSTELMRREILRLARATRHSAFISTRRLSAFYNVTEKCVLCELAKLAERTSSSSRSSGISRSPKIGTSQLAGLALPISLFQND